MIANSLHSGEHPRPRASRSASSPEALAPFDFAILGSGFAGAIAALVLRRLGYSVLLLERATHPRFVIGESSTPFANLLLERLAQRFDLPVLKDFSEWGRWQASHPEIPAGLKRGFTFYRHHPGAPLDLADRANQLLVAASPNDTVADTHWYRPDFDAFLVNAARELGAVYIDRFEIQSLELTSRWTIRAPNAAFQADFLIDASGPNSVVAQHLGIQNIGFPNMPPTRALYAHFRNVPRLVPLDPALPYPADDAAVHHIFANGWMWVLRFNNGITSAGFALNQREQASWETMVARYPTLAAQFAKAERITPLYETSPISFRRASAAGPRFALLPSAAAFVDPLLSTGFALTLLGIVRLGSLFSEHEPANIPLSALAAYEQQTFREVDAAADLVSALYAKTDNFPEFARLTMLYFAALSFTETVWRLGKEHLAPEFLLASNSDFSATRAQLCATARAGDPIDHRAIGNAIAPFDIAGLTKPERRNWHPVDLDDLLLNRAKLQATDAELNALIGTLRLPPP